LLIQRTDSGKFLSRIGQELQRLLGPGIPVTTLALAAPSAVAQYVLDISAWPEVVSLNAKGSGAGHLAPVLRQGRAGADKRFAINPEFRRYADALTKARLTQDEMLPTLMMRLAGK
jgi:hypothetical protein